MLVCLQLAERYSSSLYLTFPGSSKCNIYAISAISVQYSYCVAGSKVLNFKFLMMCGNPTLAELCNEYLNFRITFICNTCRPNVTNVTNVTNALVTIAHLKQ